MTLNKYLQYILKCTFKKVVSAQCFMSTNKSNAYIQEFQRKSVFKKPADNAGL